MCQNVSHPELNKRHLAWINEVFRCLKNKNVANRYGTYLTVSPLHSSLLPGMCHGLYGPKWNITKRQLGLSFPSVLLRTDPSQQLPPPVSSTSSLLQFRTSSHKSFLLPPPPPRPPHRRPRCWNAAICLTFLGYRHKLSWHITWLQSGLSGR